MKVKTWNERCEEHPDHQAGMVSDRMIQARMQEEIDDLRAALEKPDRQSLQAAGTHPAPCARHCEAKAFEIETRGLKSALRSALEQPEQGPVACIRALTEQCAALVWERDELQKQVWRYEKHGVTCQTYRHHVQGCGECNNDPPPPTAQRKPLTDEMVHRAMIALNTASCGDFQPTFGEIKAALEAAHGIGEKP
jgi:hypothetical protein